MSFELKCVTMLTDFGLSDETVACCKGVLLSKGLKLPIIDISHEVPPFDIVSGGWILAGALTFMPVGIHLAVVDPGVGTERKIVILHVRRGDFLVGPDNGLLLEAARRLGGIETAWSVRMELFDFSRISPTFHARDVMAPVVGDLGMGVPPSALGKEIKQEILVEYPLPEPKMEDGKITGYVAYIDSYGTVRTNILWRSLRKDIKNLRISSGWLFSIPVGRTFADVDKGDLVILEDSWGYLSIAVNQGRASDLLGCKPKDQISVEFTMQ